MRHRQALIMGFMVVKKAMKKAMKKGERDMLLDEFIGQLTHVCCAQADE